MARSSKEIIVIMDEEQAAQTDLAALNSTSSTGIYTLWKYIVAQCMNILEQLWDAKQAEINETIATDGANTGSSNWIRKKTLAFQYGDNISLIDDIPQYETIDTTKQIVTRCAIQRTAAGVVEIRVAKNDPPEKLSAGELSALQSYWTDTGDGTNQGIGIAPAGMDLTCVSLDADKIYIAGTVYYSAQYAPTIQDNVITALNNYLAGITTSNVFGGLANGVLRFNELVAAVKAAPGVSDFFVNSLVKRADTDPFGTTTSGTRVAIVSSGAVISLPVALLTAGYAVEENTAGEDWLTNLTFTSV